MTILFEAIPSNLLVPGVYTETNGNRAAASSPTLPRRMYVVGHRRTAGEVATGVPFRASSDSESERCAGLGSQLAEMLRIAKYANPYVELWGIGLADGGSAVSATGTLAFTGPSTAAGVLVLYIAPYWVGATLRGRYTVTVTSGMTATQVGAAVETAIQADPYRQVTAANVTGTVTLTARNGGIMGNKITVAHSLVAGERLPTGVALTITAMASGAVNPTLSTAITALGSQHVTHLVQPWVDDTNMTALETELTRRWGGTVQLEMYGFTSERGSLGTLTTLGTARNSPFCSIVDGGLSPTPPWCIAAEAAAVDAAMDHPGQPLRGKKLNCAFTPAAGSDRTSDDRQSLLVAGVSTVTFGSDGKCALERLVSTYQLDSNGNADSKYRDRQVAGLLFAIRYDWRTYIGGKYPNYMHAADGTPYSPGLPIVTPTTMKNEFATRARTQWALNLGWIEDPDQFLRDILIERTDDGMDMIGVPNLINRLHIVRTRFDFLR